MGLSLIGASLLANSIPQFAKLAMWVSVEPDNLFARMFLRQNSADLVDLAARLIIGVGLFFGARGIAGMWRRLRLLGTSR